MSGDQLVTARAEHFGKLHLARHLRWDHGMSRRKVAQRIGESERWVKHHVDECEEEKG